MELRKLRFRVLHAAAVVTLLFTASCGRFSARMDIREGNKLYNKFEYMKAIENYAKVPADVPERVQAVLSTGYSWMAQYRFGSGDPNDKERAQKAAEAFREYIKIRPAQTDDKTLPDVRQAKDWIITLLIDSGQYDEAVAELNKELKERPDDPALLRGLATTYDKWGKITKALENYQRWEKLFPTDPSPHVAVAAYCWNVSYRLGPNVGMEHLERNRWVDNGMVAADAALKLDANHFEGVTYKNLLLRERAKLRLDPDQVGSLIKEANVYLEKAKAIREDQKKKEEAEAAAAMAKMKQGAKPEEKPAATPSPSPKAGGA